MVKLCSVKKGFTLVEALTSMLIISIFFAIMSKTMTTRSSHELSQKPEYHHGYYECYNEKGYLTPTGAYRAGSWRTQKYSNDHFTSSKDRSSTSSAACTFTPVPGTAFAVIYAFPGDAGINEDNYKNSSLGENVLKRINVYKQYLPQFTDKVNIPKNRMGFVPTEFMNLPPEDPPELNYNDFLQFVRQNYPTSLLAQDENVNWLGPGIFICW